MKKGGFWREVFSEKGVASSKRILGAFVLIGVFAGWAFCIIREGLTEHATGLAEIFVGVAGVLLGISSVTSVFNNKNKEEE